MIWSLQVKYGPLFWTAYKRCLFYGKLGLNMRRGLLKRGCVCQHKHHLFWYCLLTTLSTCLTNCFDEIAFSNMFNRCWIWTPLAENFNKRFSKSVPFSFHILSLSCEPFVNSDVMQKIIVRRINTSLIDINGCTLIALLPYNLLNLLTIIRPSLQKYTAATFLNTKPQI